MHSPPLMRPVVLALGPCGDGGGGGKEEAKARSLPASYDGGPEFPLMTVEPPTKGRKQG
jgi:hypothetical protein